MYQNMTLVKGKTKTCVTLALQFLATPKYHHVRWVGTLSNLPTFLSAGQSLVRWGHRACEVVLCWDERSLLTLGSANGLPRGAYLVAGKMVFTSKGSRVKVWERGIFCLGSFVSRQACPRRRLISSKFQSRSSMKDVQQTPGHDRHPLIKF